MSRSSPARPWQQWPILTDGGAPTARPWQRWPIPAPDGRTAPSTHRSATPAVGNALTGHVHDHAGEPIDAVLTLVDGGGRQVSRGATGPDGAYALTAGTVAGAGLLVVRGRDGCSSPTVVSVTLGAPATHDVELRHRGAPPARGRARDGPADGAGVGGSV